MNLSHILTTFTHTRRRVAIVFLFFLLIGICSVLYVLQIPEFFSPKQFKVGSHTLTILTRPIPLLLPHAHESDADAVNSVFSTGHGVIVDSEHFTAPFDMWVTGISVNSTNAPRSVLHHLILFKEGYPNPICSNRDEEVYTVGADSRPETELPAPFGIFIKKGTKLYLSGMVHNPLPPRGEGGTYRKVSIGFELTYERDLSKRSRPLQFYRLFLYDTQHCTDPHETIEGRADVFTIPALAQHFEKRADATTANNQARYTFTTPGLLLGIGGHLHAEDGGERIKLFKNNLLLTELIPIPLPDLPWSWNMSPETVVSPIVPGDTFSVSAVYTNKNPHPIEDAMGQAVLFVAPDDVAGAMK